MARLIAALLVLSAASLAQPVHAAPGDLDPTFGVGGKVHAMPFPGMSGPHPQDGAIQPDGRIVIVGEAWFSDTGHLAIARFESDGTPDATFGNGGVVVLPKFGANKYDIAEAVEVQADGRILVAGEVDWISGNRTTGDAIVLRLLADGTLDSSFGDGGVVRTSFGPDVQGNLVDAVARQPNGKIVIAGSATVGGSRHFALARFEDDGSPDLTFGTAGRVMTALGVEDTVNAGVLQPDGKIVVGGAIWASQTGPLDAAFARYNPDGTLDGGFGSGGIVLAPSSTTSVQSLELQPDGKIVSAGGGSPRAVVMRLDPNGAFDATFATGGIMQTNASNAQALLDLVLLPDGRIVAAGFTFSAGLEDFLLIGLDGAGAFDAGFGAGGFVVTDLGETDDSATTLRRQPDGRLVAMGSGAAYLEMARYEGTPRVCGNGVPESPESCDDGGAAAGDGCDASCNVESGYACAGQPSVCTAGCGDGAIVGSEGCDDGGLVAGDGCDAACQLEPGWTCSGAPSSCTAVCGDSRVVGSEECDDGNTTSGDCCDGACLAEPVGSPCLEDGDLCSNDTCIAGGLCRHERAPDPTCLLPTASAKAKLKLVDAASDQVQFQWTKGPAVSKASFGTPAAGIPQYGFCVYDHASGSPTSVIRAFASGDADCADKACWTESAKGWRLRNTAGTPDGIVELKLTEGQVDGKSAVKVKMKGASLTLPALPFASDPKVVAQVRSSDGQCYGAVFSTPTRNDAKAYQAKSD